MPVLLFTAALTVTTGLLAGLAPVLNIGRVDLAVALKEGAPAAAGSKHSFRSGLIVGEIALTLILAFSCGLLLRSLILAQTADPGFRAGGVLALEIRVSPSRYKGDAAVREFYARLMEALRSEPGVLSVGAVDCPPSTGGCAAGWYSIADMPAPARDDVPLTLLTAADPEYFHTMGIRLLAGRGFTDADRENREGVLLINEKLARHWWPQAPQLAVGHPLKLGGPYLDGPVYAIAGVVADVRQRGLDLEPVSEVYAPLSQRVSPAMVIMIRAGGDPSRLIAAVRRDVAATGRNVPVQSLRPFEEWMGATLERRRFSALLLAVFGILAFVLSSIGIYGVLNHWAGMRQKEIAIRLALGAQRAEILRWTGWHAMRLIAMGIAFGVLGCWGASQWLGSLVFRISAWNPPVMLAAVAAVIFMAALAAAVPIWRATRVDAIRNLRAS